MPRDRSQRRRLLLGFIPLLLYLQLPRLYAVDLLFNGFRPSDLLLYGDAALFTVTDGSQPVGNGSQYLSITNASEFSVGRALYSSKVPMTSPNSSTVLPFSASFIFSMARIRGTLPGHGIAFLFSPLPGIEGSADTRAAQNLGLFNRTINGDPSNGVVAVEFDVFKNEEFNDIDANHVGVDVFSLSSEAAHPAGYWRDDGSGSDFVRLSLNDGSNYQAWVDFSSGRLNVTMAPVELGTKPRRPLISLDLNLSAIFQKEMYVGFCGATGRLVESHRVLGWSFSNSNLSLSRGLITTGLPNFVPAKSPSRSKALIAGISAAVAAAGVVIALVGCLVLHRRRRGRKGWRKRKDAADADDDGSGSGGGNGPVELWESEYWPHRIGYREIVSATEGFSEKNLIGCGGNGRVYKGVLGGEAVAVKHLWHSTGKEVREFLSEVSTLGRLKHRNLVGLKGWCRRRSGDLILVYEYMENGSLDKLIFFPDVGGGNNDNNRGGVALDWAKRVRILKDVAEGLLYLHEGWEWRVLHRDIKASNVMLDADMVARLGDFGLARVHAHGGAPTTTSVVGTVGYMAPEVMRNGRATAATDVFGFGVLVLEVVCGRRAIIEVEKTTSDSLAIPSQPLAEWVWGLLEKGLAATAVDSTVRGTRGFDEEEAARTLRIGLWCSCGDPAARPTMRQVVSAWGGGQIGPLVKGEEEAEGKAADAYLVDKLRTATPPPPPWSGSLGNYCYKETPQFHSDDSHPTFEVLKFSSMSLLSSSDIMEGR